MPEKHIQHLKQFVASCSSDPKCLHVLDVFGVSQRVAETWRSAGYGGWSFDIKLSEDQDICAEGGFKLLLRKAMEFLGSQKLGKRSWE